MSTYNQPTIYNIAAGENFLRVFAEYIVQNYDENTIASAKIFLPTRRACRLLQQEFLDLSGGKAILLPHLLPLGDIDEEELFWSLHEDIEDIPLAIDALQREFLLVQLIARFYGDDMSKKNQILFARDLARFLDEAIIEDIDLKNLNNIIPDNLAAHWEITNEFIKILAEYWPEILSSMEKIDSVDRRNRLIRSYKNFLDLTRPDDLMIVAGSTGSVPASAELMHSLSRLPNGCVILSGMDTDLDEKSWASLNEDHPQFPLKRLLSRLDAKRTHVQALGGNNKRALVIREMMRPSETLQQWEELISYKDVISRNLDQLSIIECHSMQNEALCIALKIRDIAQKPAKTCVFVTPDRALAHQVSQICARWNLKIDDSSGQNMRKNHKFNFFFQIIDCVLEDFSVISCVSLLKNQFFNLNLLSRDDIFQFEARSLRGFKRDFFDCDDGNSNELKDFQDNFRELFVNFSHFKTQKDVFENILKEHLSLLENFSDTDQFFIDNDADFLQKTLFSLVNISDDIGPLSLQDYRDILETSLYSNPLRENVAPHPRIHILGQLEARLMHADCVILGGLNEGVWPRDVHHDLFLSPHMREILGMTPADYQIGLSAHDFQNLLGADEILLTRSKTNTGSPTIPSRWLTRLKTVMQAADIEPSSYQNHSLESWSNMLDHAENIEPIHRPAPRPALQHRPKRLSITRIENWFKNPYAIYASEILKLKPLEPLDKDFDAGEQGSLYHDILDQIITQNQNAPGSDFDQKAFKIASEMIADRTFSPFWHEKFKRHLQSFIDHETIWRETYKPLSTEEKGTLYFEQFSFTLSGIADRIDTAQSNKMAIIDYKTAGQFTIKQFQEGFYMQLPLEAIMALRGGFKNLPHNAAIGSLEYWVFGGLETPFKRMCLDHEKGHDIDHLLSQTEEKLVSLLEFFSKPHSPYYATPHNEYALRYNDYAHLERQAEWANELAHGAGENA